MSKPNHILSCFIDESGDFGPYEAHSPYYYVTFVLHDQNSDLTNMINGLNQRMSNEGIASHAIHTGPLIRRENHYEFESLTERRHLFNILYFFAIRLPIKYFCIRVNNQSSEGKTVLIDSINKELSRKIDIHMDYWKQFEQINIYYDNGQTELTKIITAVFHSKFPKVSIRKVSPVDYKLFQVADLICTMESIHNKEVYNQMSHSESVFFGGRQKFKKDYYRKLTAKRM